MLPGGRSSLVGGMVGHSCEIVSLVLMSLERELYPIGLLACLLPSRNKHRFHKSLFKAENSISM